MFKLPELPYPYEALEPYISAHTMRCHYDDHHRRYLNKLNDALGDIDFNYQSVEDIVRKSVGHKHLTHVYNNAAQVLNHAFFWDCMTPGGGGEPRGALKDAIDEYFGSLSAFRDAFVESATGRFGSGYVCLVSNKGTLSIRDTANADPADINGGDALLCCDLWEHAYYLDYQNGRADFVKVFLDNLVDWDFVTARLAGEIEHPRILLDE